MRILYQTSTANEHQSTLPHLLAQGFTVDTVDNFDATHAHLNAAPYDLIIMSANDKSDDTDVIHQLRAFSSVPLIMLSYNASVSKISKQLFAGADDVITPTNTPIHPHELIARAYAVTARTMAHDLQQKESLIKTGHLEVDLLQGTVRVKGTLVKLTPYQMNTLFLMAQHIGDNITRKDFIEIAGNKNDGVTTINICRIRQEFEKLDPAINYIENAFDIGYRLRNLDQQGQEIQKPFMIIPLEALDKHNRKRLRHANNFIA